MTEKKYLLDKIPDYMLDIAIEVVENVLDNQGVDVYVLAKKFIIPLMNEYSKEGAEIRLESYNNALDERDIAIAERNNVEREASVLRKRNGELISISEFDKEKLRIIQIDLDKYKDFYETVKKHIMPGENQISLEALYSVLLRIFLQDAAKV